MERKNGTGTSFDVVRFNNAKRNADCARNLFFGGVRLWHGLFPLRVADQTKNEEPCSSECVSKGTHRGANPEIVAVICGTGEPHSKNEAEVPFLFRFVSFPVLGSVLSPIPCVSQQTRATEGRNAGRNAVHVL
mmetsp:Transcript_13717/g.28899  ORF Transcript_13717/g.28899 Transcript_13717/m.28899 type:complete len:133 (-) Transcript_13717:32-430(-)